MAKRRGRAGRKRSVPVTLACAERRIELKPQDARQIGWEARQRQFGLSPKEAATDMAGSVLGRLCLAGELGDSAYRRQVYYENGKAYAEIVAEYRWALKVKMPGSASDLGKSFAHEPDLEALEPEERARFFHRHDRALRLYEMAERRLASCGDPRAASVLHAVCVDDQHPGLSSIPTLRTALNAVQLVRQLDDGS